MTAPIQPQQLTNIAGYDSASYVQNNGETVVTLKRKDGTKEYSITLTFHKPIDEANIRSYLAAKETKEKIDQMVQQYDVFSPTYGSKKDCRLESQGGKLFFLYTGKKGLERRLDLSNDESGASFYYRFEHYKKKIEEAKNDADREKKFRAKRDALGEIQKKFQPLAKILKAPSHPEPRNLDPAIHVGVNPPQPPAPTNQTPPAAPAAQPAPAVQPAAPATQTA